MLGGAELVEVSSDGEPGDKARFVRGVERALLDGEADIGVHSAKDLPAELPEGLAIAAVPPREDPADVWIGAGASLDEVAEGARVGTASLRRRAQLLAARPDLRVERAARQRRHPAAPARGGRARRDRARRRRAAAARARGRGLLRDPGRGDDPGGRPGRAGPPDPRPATRRREAAVGGDRRRAGAARADRRARRRRPAGRDLRRARSASTRPVDRRAGRSRSTPSSASPTAASGSATGSRRTPTEPALAGAMLAERLLGAGAREILDRAEDARACRGYGGYAPKGAAEA